MSEPTRRFMCLPDGTMYESARGQWVGYDVLKLATQRAEAAEAERDALRKLSAFLRSVIHCGEQWSNQCQEMYDAALKVQP